MSESLEKIDATIAAMSITDVEKIDHPPVYTCEAADAYTPNPAAGLKSILMATRSKVWMVCVLLGSQRVDTKKVKTLMGGKVQFATAEEAVQVIGCEAGSVPPFGHKTTVRILVDPAVEGMERVYFNPGVNTKTYGLAMPDFRRIVEHCGGTFTDIAEKK